ncbi:hypothetical protein Droror1_Dr00000557 [Drosera rotundifolia]
MWNPTSTNTHFPDLSLTLDFNQYQKPKTLEFLCFEMGQNRRGDSGRGVRLKMKQIWREIPITDPSFLSNILAVDGESLFVVSSRAFFPCSLGGDLRRVFVAALTWTNPDDSFLKGDNAQPAPTLRHKVIPVRIDIP